MDNSGRRFSSLLLFQFQQLLFHELVQHFLLLWVTNGSDVGESTLFIACEIYNLKSGKRWRLHERRSPSRTWWLRKDCYQGNVRTAKFVVGEENLEHHSSDQPHNSLLQHLCGGQQLFLATPYPLPPNTISSSKIMESKLQEKQQGRDDKRET